MMLAIAQDILLVQFRGIVVRECRRLQAAGSSYQSRQAADDGCTVDGGALTPSTWIIRRAATRLSGSGSAEGPVRAEAFRGGSGVMLQTGPLVEG